MNKVRVRAYQKPEGAGESANFEMEVKGKITNFESAVATSVEEVLRWLKLMKNLGAKSGFSCRQPLHFQVFRDGMLLCDTGDSTVFETRSYGVLKVPTTSAKSRAKFRNRLVEVFQYAYQDVETLKSFRELQASGAKEVAGIVASAAKG